MSIELCHCAECYGLHWTGYKCAGCGDETERLIRAYDGQNLNDIWDLAALWAKKKQVDAAEMAAMEIIYRRDITIDDYPLPLRSLIRENLKMYAYAQATREAAEAAWLAAKRGGKR